MRSAATGDGQRRPSARAGRNSDRCRSPPVLPAISTRDWSTEALHDLDWHDASYLFVENVGNLVCPAVYDLGQAVNVVPCR